MRPERLLILTPGFSGFDGVSTVAREAARALGDPRWELEVWSLLDADIPGGRGAGGRRSRFGAWAMAEALRSRAGGLLVLALHVHVAVAALPLRARGARLAVFLHGIEAWGALSATRRLALAAAEPLISNSRYTAERVTAAHGRWLRSAVRPCHLGVPDAGSAQGPSTVAPGFVLSVGRLSAGERYKGTDALLEVWPDVLRARPDARLVVVGEGDDRLRLQAKAAPLGDRALFLGQVEADALARLYRDCALFSLPSTGEGFGLVYLEAMRAGKAVLAGPGAPGEVVEDGVTGRIVDPADRRRLAACLLELLAEPATLDELGRRGAAAWAARFTAGAFEARLRQALALPLRD